MPSPNIGRKGKWSEQSFFKFRKIQETAAAAKFNEHHTEATQPTLLLNDDIDPSNIVEGTITRIHARIKDAAADTCILRIWRTNTNGAVTPYALQMNKLYETVVLANDVEYDIINLSIPFRLAEAGKLYYGLEWTTAAAPAGNVQGFIEVSGETMK
jgi:hypothetical protein